MSNAQCSECGGKILITVTTVRKHDGQIFRKKKVSQDNSHDLCHKCWVALSQRAKEKFETLQSQEIERME